MSCSLAKPACSPAQIRSPLGPLHPPAPRRAPALCLTLKPRREGPGSSPSCLFCFPKFLSFAGHIFRRVGWWPGVRTFLNYYFFFSYNKSLLKDKETNPVPAFTICLKQDKSNAGLDMASTRPAKTAVCWCAVCSGDGGAVLQEAVGALPSSVLSVFMQIQTYKHPSALGQEHHVEGHTLMHRQAATLPPGKGGSCR